MSMRVRNSPFPASGDGGGGGGLGPRPGMGGGGGGGVRPPASNGWDESEFPDWAKDPVAAPVQPLQPAQQPGFAQPQQQAFPQQGVQQPGMMQPGMQQPGMQQPGMMQPGMQQPGMQQPGMMQQGMQQQPGMMQPGMQQPGMMQPGMQQQQPGMMQPGMTVPFQPGQQQPGQAFPDKQQMQAGLNAGMGSLGMSDTQQALAAAAMNQAFGHVPFAQATGWFAGFYMALQGLFNVGHGFVLRKLVFLMCPFIKRSQDPAGSGYMAGDQSPVSSGVGADGLKMDIEDPDLYIPSMGVLTYGAVFALQRLTLGAFQPEVVMGAMWFSVFLWALEVIVAKVIFFVAGSQVSALDVTATAGYKFLHVSVMVLVRIVMPINFVYYPCVVYLGACSAWAARRFMLHYKQSPIQQQYGVQPSALHNHAILGLAIAQPGICWLLTPWGTA